MATAFDHYNLLLADHYSWIHGDFDARCDAAVAWFRERGIAPESTSLGLDLGAGAGCHSLALAKLGFRVRAIDFSPKLLAELTAHAKGADVEVIAADLMDFRAWGKELPAVITCMGDTLTHLPRFEDVRALFRGVRERLAPEGRFVVTYRDLSTPLEGAQRFIPIRSDANRIFTCFLEYDPERVEVHDLVYVRGESGWRLTTSSYPKLRITRERATECLVEVGFAIEHADVVRGMTEIVARA